MVLIIPMSGIGKRFLTAGYKKPKQLLMVDGKPVIEHVLDMFPGEEDVIFICNTEHLKNTDLKKVLLSLKPRAKIVEIPIHDKGPVFAIQQAYNKIPDGEEALVSYCDFTGKWEYENFKKAVKRMDGCIPAYIGFHPHLLGPGFYGHMRWDENNMMLEIKEKESFSEDKMDDYGAVGIYWFKTGEIMKKYFDEAVKRDLKTKNEFFCSLPYNLMVRDGLKVLVYEMEQFCQWGTPEDLEEYTYWARKFGRGKTDIPPNREKFVKPRETSDENIRKTSDYWEKYFS